MPQVARRPPRSRFGVVLRRGRKVRDPAGRLPAKAGQFQMADPSSGCHPGSGRREGRYLTARAATVAAKSSTKQDKLI